MRNYFVHCFALPAFVWCLVSPPAQLSRRVRGIAPSGTFAPVAGSASWSTYSGAGGSSWSDPCHYSPWTSQSPGSINVAMDTIKTFQSPKQNSNGLLSGEPLCLPFYNENAIFKVPGDQFAPFHQDLLFYPWEGLRVRGAPICAARPGWPLWRRVVRVAVSFRVSISVLTTSPSTSSSDGRVTWGPNTCRSWTHTITSVFFEADFVFSNLFQFAAVSHKITVLLVKKIVLSTYWFDTVDRSWQMLEVRTRSGWEWESWGCGWLEMNWPNLLFDVFK